MNRRRFIVLLAVTALAAAPALGADAVRGGDISVEQPWSRATVPGASTGAVYMTLSTAGKAADRLVKVESAAAKVAELHTMSMEGGVMRMRPVQAIDVKPGAKTELKPGGLHVMLIGLTRPLVEGEIVPLALTFEKAGRVEVQAKIGKVGAQSGDAAKAHSH